MNLRIKKNKNFFTARLKGLDQHVSIYIVSRCITIFEIRVSLHGMFLRSFCLFYLVGTCWFLFLSFSWELYCILKGNIAHSLIFMAYSFDHIKMITSISILRNLDCIFYLLTQIKMCVERIVKYIKINTHTHNYIIKCIIKRYKMYVKIQLKKNHERLKNHYEKYLVNTNLLLTISLIEK